MKLTIGFVFRTFAAIVFNIFLTPVFALYGLIYLATYVEKCVVNLLFNRDGRLKLVPGTDAWFLGDFEHDKTKGIATGLFFLEGKLDFDRPKSMLRKLLETKDENGRLVYWKLRKHVIKIADFFFYESDANFKLEDHAKYFEDRILRSESECKELANEIVNEEFPADQSPWCFQFYPYRNPVTGEEDTFAVMKVSHILADGLHWGAIVSKYFGENIDQTTYFKLAKASSRISTPWLRLLTVLHMPSMLLREMRFRNHSPLSFLGSVKSGELVCNWSGPMDLRTAKEIKNRTKDSTVTQVFLAVMSQSLKEMFKKYEMEFPKKNLKAGLAVCLANGDNNLLNLENKIGLHFLDLPVHCSSATECLDELVNRGTSLEDVLRILMTDTLTWFLFNYIPYRLANNLIKLWDCSNFYSSIPYCDNDMPTVFKMRLRNGLFLAPLMEKTGFAGVFYVIGNTVRFGLIANRAVLPGPEALDFACENCEKQLLQMANHLKITVPKNNTE